MNTIYLNGSDLSLIIEKITSDIVSEKRGGKNFDVWADLESDKNLLTEDSDDLTRGLFSLTKYNNGEYKSEAQKNFLLKKAEDFGFILGSVKTSIDNANTGGNWGKVIYTDYKFYVDDIGVYKVIKIVKRKGVPVEQIYWEKNDQSKQRSDMYSTDSEYVKLKKQVVRIVYEKSKPIVCEIALTLTPFMDNATNEQLYEQGVQLLSLVGMKCLTFETADGIKKMLNPHSSIDLSLIKNQPFYNKVVELIERLIDIYPDELNKYDASSTQILKDIISQYQNVNESKRLGKNFDAWADLESSGEHTKALKRDRVDKEKIGNKNAEYVHNKNRKLGRSGIDVNESENKKEQDNMKNKIKLTESELIAFINKIVEGVINEDYRETPLELRRYKDSNDVVYSFEQLEQDTINYNASLEDGEEPLIDDIQLEMIKRLPLNGKLNIDMNDYILRIK